MIELRGIWVRCVSIRLEVRAWTYSESEQTHPSRGRDEDGRRQPLLLLLLPRPGAEPREHFGILAVALVCASLSDIRGCEVKWAATQRRRPAKGSLRRRLEIGPVDRTRRIAQAACFCVSCVGSRGISVCCCVFRASWRLGVEVRCGPLGTLGGRPNEADDGASIARIADFDSEEFAQPGLDPPQPQPKAQAHPPSHPVDPDGTQRSRRSMPVTVSIRARSIDPSIGRSIDHGSRACSNSLRNSPLFA